MNHQVLSIKNLSIAYQNRGQWMPVVENLSFDLMQGKTLGVLGESGSGKTVSSLALMGLLPPALKIISGSIIYSGHPAEHLELVGMDDRVLRKIRGKEISMVFQEPMSSLNPVKRCGEQVAEMIRLHEGASTRDALDKTYSLFNEVQLPIPGRIINSWPHELSGGQQQRVMIAMAISSNPKILIADEPTTALDVTVQKSILQLISDLQEKHKMGIIFITHDIGIIGEVSDEVMVMKNGKAVESGSLNRIINNPEHDYTRQLIACRPSLKDRPEKLATVQGGDQAIANKGKMEKETLKRGERHARIYRADPILTVNSLKKYFSRGTGWIGKKKEIVKAVDDISFEVFKGETLGLVGESGSGKTTLGRTIIQLIESTEGEVRYRGLLVNQLPPSKLMEFRKKFQIVFQDPFSSLNPRIPVGKAIMEPMKVHGIGDSDADRKQRLFELLEKVRLLPDHHTRFPHQFSGGQRQRLVIARALAMDPEFLICDESVSSLDVSIQAEILNLLNDLKNEMDLTYIFISHDLSVVKYMSDRVLVLQKGKMVELEEADKLYSNPRSDYTRKLIASIPGAAIKDAR